MSKWRRLCDRQVSVEVIGLGLLGVELAEALIFHFYRRLVSCHEHFHFLALSLKWPLNASPRSLSKHIGQIIGVRWFHLVGQGHLHSFFLQKVFSALQELRFFVLAIWSKGVSYLSVVRTNSSEQIFLSPNFFPRLMPCGWLPLEVYALLWLWIVVVCIFTVQFGRHWPLGIVLFILNVNPRLSSVRLVFKTSLFLYLLLRNLDDVLVEATHIFLRLSRSFKRVFRVETQFHGLVLIVIQPLVEKISGD